MASVTPALRWWMKSMVSQMDNASRRLDPATMTPRTWLMLRANHNPNNMRAGMMTKNVNGNIILNILII